MGYADVVRLPPYDGSTVPRRAQGSLLTSQLSAGTSQGSFSSQFKIHSLQNGKAFALGTEFGDFRVFATERASEDLPKALLGSKKPLSLGCVSRGEHGCDESEWRGWKIPGPLRRYQQSFDCSLAAQLRNPTNASSLNEIFNWQDPTSVLLSGVAGSPFVPRSQWDFWETPSSLLAVHIGNFQDNFALRILDERCTAPNDHVCVDMDATDNRGSPYVSVCFMNDRCVACAVENQHGRFGHSSLIKLFDTRMVRNGAAPSTTVLPSFPRSSAHGLHADEKFDLIYDSIGCSTVKVTRDNCEWPSTQSPSPWLWDLTRLHDGSLMVTTLDGLDLVLDCTNQTTITVKNRDESIRSRGPPLYAIDKEHGTVAVYEDPTGSRQEIALHTVKDKELHRHRGHKRKNSGERNFKIETQIQDSNGLQTELSDMAFNESGTAIVGASQDGDIFVWRT